MVAHVGPETIVAPRFDVRVRRVDGQFLVALADQTYSLSESTAFLWRKVDGRRTVADISQLLAAEYDIDLDTALADTTEVLHELSTLGLLRLGPGGSVSAGERG